MVSFECDSNKMLTELNNLGKWVEKADGIDYETKNLPLVSVSEKGKGMGQLNRPHDVIVDKKTVSIHIGDTFNNFVKVFDSTGKY